MRRRGKMALAGGTALLRAVVGGLRGPGRPLWARDAPQLCSTQAAAKAPPTPPSPYQEKPWAYLESEEYRATYGDNPVWHGYRRNHKGAIPPQRTRKTCLRKGKLVGNPCPICRDRNLHVDFRVGWGWGRIWEGSPPPHTLCFPHFPPPPLPFSSLHFVFAHLFLPVECEAPGPVYLPPLRRHLPPHVHRGLHEAAQAPIQGHHAGAGTRSPMATGALRACPSGRFLQPTPSCWQNPASTHPGPRTPLVSLVRVAASPCCRHRPHAPPLQGLLEGKRISTGRGDTHGYTSGSLRGAQGGIKRLQPSCEMRCLPSSTQTPEGGWN